MTHVAHIVDTLYLEHMSLIRGEVRISLDGGSHLLKLGTLFELYIHHAAVDTLAEGNRHRERILHAGLGTYADAVAHRHTRTEVGIAESLRSKTLHQGADDGVGTRIPACGNDADGIRLLIQFHQTFAIAADISVDIERIDGIDTQGKNLIGILLTRASWRSENGYIHILQFADILYHIILR